MPGITVSDCPICVRGYPLDVLAEFPTTWVTDGIEAPLPGYACVVAKRHVAEPFELGEAERVAFWEDSMCTARALARLFKPRTMNYEIHGNTIPHLHMGVADQPAVAWNDGASIGAASRIKRSGSAGTRPTHPTQERKRKNGAEVFRTLNNVCCVVIGQPPVVAIKVEVPFAAIGWWASREQPVLIHLKNNLVVRDRGPEALRKRLLELERLVALQHVKDLADVRHVAASSRARCEPG